MMLIAASCPSNRLAAVTKRTGCCGGAIGGAPRIVVRLSDILLSRREDRGKDACGLSEARAVPGQEPPADQTRRLPANASGPSSAVNAYGSSGSTTRSAPEARISLDRCAGSARDRRRTRCRRRAGRARHRRTCRGPTTIHGRRQIGTTARRRTAGSGTALHAASASASQPARGKPHTASIRRSETNAPSSVSDVGHVHRRRRPRAGRRGRTRGSPRRWRARGRGASSTILSTSGFFVPPTRGTSRPGGWVHQSVAPTSRSPRADGDRLGERRHDADDPPDRAPQRDRVPHVVDDHRRDATACRPAPGRPAARRTP